MLNNFECKMTVRYTVSQDSFIGHVELELESLWDQDDVVRCTHVSLDLERYGKFGNPTHFENAVCEDCDFELHLEEDAMNSFGRHLVLGWIVGKPPFVMDPSYDFPHGSKVWC